MTTDLRSKYMRALETFLERAKADNYCIAAILTGSLWHDVVWEKSDIDLLLIVEDSKEPFKYYSLTQDGILINTSIYNRIHFRRSFDAALNSSMFHSWLSKSTLLFSRDETIADLYESMTQLGERDRDDFLLLKGAIAVAHLAKAWKWLKVKGDFMYSYLEIIKSLDNLAAIEITLHGEIPSREVIEQAHKFQHPLFPFLYIELAQEPKDQDLIAGALDRIEEYVKERTNQLFRPVLTLLKEAGEIVGTSEIQRQLTAVSKLDGGLLAEALAWLTQQQVIELFPTPIRLTNKSRVQVDEAGYYYQGGIKS